MREEGGVRGGGGGEGGGEECVWFNDLKYKLKILTTGTEQTPPGHFFFFLNLIWPTGGNIPVQVITRCLRVKVFH